MPTITDTYTGLSFDISRLTARDIQVACMSCWPDCEDEWADEMSNVVRRAATEVLRSAQASHSGAHGVALQAIAARHGYLTAALLDPSACHAWREARRRLTGCYGGRRANQMLHVVAMELFLAEPVYH